MKCVVKKAGCQRGQSSDKTKLVSPNNNIQYFKGCIFSFVGEWTDRNICGGGGGGWGNESKKLTLCWFF